MDRRLFNTNFFVYKYYSPELDVYYIGSHHCRAWKWGTCSDTVCNYKSSSAVVARLKRERPRATWEMLILGWAQDEDTLMAMELSWIRRHFGDPKCLNKRVISPPRRQMGEGRRRVVEMVDPMGALQKPRVEYFLELLASGWQPTNKATVRIRNDEERLECYIWLPTLRKNIKNVIKTNWSYGGCRDYDRISTKQFLKLMKKVNVIEELDAKPALFKPERAEATESSDIGWPFFLQTY